MSALSVRVHWALAAAHWQFTCMMTSVAVRAWGTGCWWWVLEC